MFDHPNGLLPGTSADGRCRSAGEHIAMAYRLPVATFYHKKRFCKSEWRKNSVKPHFFVFLSDLK